MLHESSHPFLVLRQRVVAEIEVLHLLAVFSDDLHDVRQLSPMNVDIAQVQLLDMRHRLDHSFERLHEDELIDLYMR